jgi:hypothetical protein
MYEYCAKAEFLASHELYCRREKEERERLLLQQQQMKLYPHQLYQRHPQYHPRF